MTKKYIDDQNLDFLQEIEDKEQSSDQSFIKPEKRRSGKKWLVLFLSFTVFIFSSFLYVQASASPLSQGLKTLPWIQNITQLIHPNNNIIENEDIDVINTVIIGMGGENHDGGYLADTIILLKFKKSTNQLAIISIPRDLAVDLPGYGWRKINNANAYGGPELLTEMISEILNEPVPYYITIDFSGFADLINSIGGIDVYIERSFTDLEFPDENYEFQTVSFSQGMQHMNGDQALKYSRSRHGDNNEAGDFARSVRQQQVIFAIKDKIISSNTLLNPSKLIALYNNFTKYIDTNIKTSEMISLAQTAQGFREVNVKKVLLTDGPNGLLDATIHESGAYLLIPKSGYGNYDDIRNYLDGLFTESNSTTTDTNINTVNNEVKTTEIKTPAPTITNIEPLVEKAETPKIIILNGTTIPGYAGELSRQLEAKNFTVLDIANNIVQTLDNTTVYELHPGATPNSRTILSNIIVFDSLNQIPSDLENYISILSGSENLRAADYIIILGSDNRNIIEE